MMSVYQQIKEKFIMKNAWKDWEEYRSQLTDIILETNPESICIIGAGRCNDIDLLRILNTAERVICMDVDYESMLSGTVNLPQNLRQKLELKAISLTGITEQVMERFCNEMLVFVRAGGKNLSYESIREYMLKSIRELEDKMIQNEYALQDILLPQKVDRPESLADVIVCSGVHSQLFSLLSFFLRSFINSIQEIVPDIHEAETEIHKEIRRMNDRIIPLINNSLLSVTGKTVIFGNEYNPQNPVEGAYQCILDVRDRMNPVEKHLIWDFNPIEGIRYEMLIQAVDIRK